MPRPDMSLVLRISKAALVSAVALTASLVTFDNLTDYGTNRAFVGHVLAMDTIFPGSLIHYRAVTSPGLQTLAYWLIIAAEAVTAACCWIGAFSLLRAARQSRSAFQAAKAWGVAGLTLGFLTWQAGFMAIGGEWFGMWQSPAWNGVPSAFRFQMTMIAVLIYLILPEQERFPPPN